MEDHITDCNHEIHDYGCEGPWGDKQNCNEVSNEEEKIVAIVAIVLSVLFPAISILYVSFLYRCGKTAAIPANPEQSKVVDIELVTTRSSEVVLNKMMTSKTIDDTFREY
jgi:hypothetical protein